MYLGGNNFSGCVPYVLRSIEFNDVRELMIKTCAPSLTTSSGDSVCANGIAVHDFETYPGSVRDCEILLVVRDILAGDAWLNWNANIPLRDWHGVNVSEDGVRSLELAQRWLNGSIPPELGRLANLGMLELNGNQLTGEIPAELGNLADMRHLDLKNNLLTGSIPAELGNLINLRTLRLGGNLLSGEIPGELGNLTNLEILGLQINPVNEEIPAWIGDLPKLQVLWLFGIYIPVGIQPE